MDDLTKIDELRRRFNITYKEAADILNETAGDVVAALVKLEEKTKAEAEEILQKGPEMFDKVKDSVKDNMRRKIIITRDGKTVAQVPASVGALGVLGAIVSTPVAVIAGVGTLTALAKNYSFKLTEKEEKLVNEQPQVTQQYHYAETFEPEVKTENDNKNSL